MQSVARLALDQLILVRIQAGQPKFEPRVYPGAQIFGGTRLEKRVVKGKDRFPLRGSEKIEGGVTGANPRKQMSPPEGNR